MTMMHFDWEQLIALLAGDREFCEELRRHELVPENTLRFSAVTIERARVARTLVRELDVNWAGVEIILRMREDLIATRRQVGDLVGELKRHAAQVDEAEKNGTE